MNPSERATNPSIEPDSGSAVLPTHNSPPIDRASSPKRAADAEHGQADFAGKGKDSAWSFSNKDRAPRRSPADRSWKSDKNR